MEAELPSPEYYTPDIKKHGTIDDTAFKKTLHLKVGAKVMLIHNIGILLLVQMLDVPRGATEQLHILTPRSCNAAGTCFICRWGIQLFCRGWAEPNDLLEQLHEAICLWLAL